MNTADITALKSLLESPKKIVITTHRKPDGDAMGSSFGLAHYLRNIGHTVDVVIPTPFPRNLSCVPGSQGAIIYSKATESLIDELYDQADLAFCLDCPALGMLFDIGKKFTASKADKIIIDHHFFMDDFGEILTFRDTDASSTAQMVYRLIRDMGARDKINTDSANALYVGLMTDSGQFKFPRTTPEVFEIAGDLVRLGADNVLLSRAIYDSNTTEAIKFLGFMLSERLVIIEEYHTAYFYVTPKDFKQFNATSDDTEGIVNYALSMKNIKLAAFMTDLGSKIKLSLRSKGTLDVNEMARTHFEGGGHMNAAGCSSYEPLDKVRKEFEALLPLYKDQLTSGINT